MTVQASGVVLSEATVAALVGDIFAALGYNSDECRLLAESLIGGSRAGYPSHGVMRIPVYVDDTRSGAVTPGALPVVTHETSSVVAIDGRQCLGQVASVFALEQATAKAGESGVGCATVKNANDMGCLGFYLQEPARQGLVALLMVNMAGGAACVAPFGSNVPFLSTNPIAVGVPRGGDKPPIVIDFSTSVVSLGRIRMAANEGAEVPEGWLVDRSGRPVTNPDRVFSLPRQAALLPAGGHKGFLLGLIVEVLAGGLSGAGMSTGSEPRLADRGMFVLVFNPDLIGGGQALSDEIEGFVAALESLPPAAPDRGVRLPGIPREEAVSGEISVDHTTWTRITEIVRELSIEGDYPILKTLDN